jgi:hypothetical protein
LFPSIKDNKARKFAISLPLIEAVHITKARLFDWLLI